MILVHFQSKPFNMTEIQVYTPTTNAREAEVDVFLEDLRDLLNLTHAHTPQKRCPFHHRGLKYKSRKSRDIWTNRQVWPWNTNKAGPKLTEFCEENALVLANTLFQQHRTCSLRSGKGKEMDFPLQPPEKNAGLLALDFNPLNCIFLNLILFYFIFL